MPTPRDIDFVALRGLHTKHGHVYPPNSVIFREGEVGHDFYVILEGEVELSVTRPDGFSEVLAVLERGDFFGEMGVFRGEPRSATARARTSVALLYFGERTATELLVNSPRFALGIIRALCDRLGVADREMVDLRHKLEAHRAYETSHGLEFTPPAVEAPASPIASQPRQADDLTPLPQTVTDRDIDRLWSELDQNVGAQTAHAASDAAAAAAPDLPTAESGR